MKGYFVLCLIVIIAKLGFCINLRNSYTAAVVDYVHILADSPKETFQLNVDQYLKHINFAARQYAKIIVFPEYGLVDIITLYDAASKNNLEDYSSFVPDPTRKEIPCNDKNFKRYAMPLVNISCQAKLDEIYIVFNLPEKGIKNETTGTLAYYNTNVVIDKSGAVIARHRKIHLSEEPFLEAGNELVTFTTDFNVTFGIFTCFDILFKYPAEDILDIEGVTDIIFPTAWYSETPFLQALSIQHGYVKRNGVNFLAANLQEPEHQDGGSGIYLADGTIAELYISADLVSKVIIQEVPLIKNRLPAEVCQFTADAVIGNQKRKEHKKISDVNIDDFPMSREDLEGYVFESLSKGPNTTKRVCSEDDSFCCTFTIIVDKSLEEPDYTYKLAAYSGLSKYGSDYYGGTRACAVLACLNETDSSCGFKLKSSMRSVTLRSIYIETIFDVENDTYNQPSTLKQDLTPLEEYVYCENSIDDNTKTKITMRAITPQDSLITFGIYSRLYELDYIPTPPPDPEQVPLNTSLILLIMSASVILLVFSGVILYKYCTKHD